MRSLATLLSFAAFTCLVQCSAQNGHNAAEAQPGPIYKDPTADVEDRVTDLLSRMTVQEKAAQLVQGDFESWIDTETNAFNYTGLVENMETRASSFYVGHPVPQQWVTEGVRKAQEYLMENTTFGIPAFVQSEGIHGFLIGM
jgi:beta-glucosidase